MKELDITKCLVHVILHLLPLLFWSCKGLTQNSSSLFSSTSSPSDSSSLTDTASSWTFVGTGYLAVYPTLFSNQNQDFKLLFRTKHSYGYLFCHILKEYKQNENSLIENYELCAELYEGSLKLTYNLNNNMDSFNIGKALNDDKWHSLQVIVVPSSSDLIVTLDGISQSHPLSSLIGSELVLDWNSLSSVILYGGKNAESHPSQFIGCLKNLQILDVNGTFSNIESPVITGTVIPGCRDLCVTDNPCQGGTPCINYYSYAKCDCSGTDLQGQYCNQSVSTKITLRGYEWITYQLYDNPEDRVFSEHNRFSLQFKSDRGAGVLIYAVGSYPHDSHVIASVLDGVVTASVGFKNDVTLEAQLGTAVDDYKEDKGWHNLTILHNKNTVTFVLDDEEEVKTTDSSSYFLSLDSKIFFGGGKDFVITKGLQVTQNFVGCLKNVYVDDVSLVYEMKHDNKRVIHSGSHQPQYGCHQVEDIPMSFPRPGTMIVLDTPSDTDLQVQFGFRTVRDVAIILHAQVISVDGYGIGYIEIWIRDHQVILHLVPSTRKPDLSRDITIDRVVNNNQWHTLHLHFTGRNTKLKIDHLSNQVDHSGLLELHGQLVIGYGQRLAYDENDGFVGCIRNLVMQNESQDPINLLHTQSVVYGVILDGCHLVPHCDGGPHCEHGGKCLSDWDGVSCDCSDTAYEGHACHFAKYRQSCDSYFQAGYRQTGAYQIDLDGTGPLKPVYVWCEMDYIFQGQTHGMTKIDHNFIPNTQIRAKGMYDMRKLISYRGLSREELVQLTETSGWCEQLVEYDCYSAPLKLGISTIFESASGEILELRDNTDPDSLCSCRKGTCPSHRCKCDKGHAQWERDSGYIRYRKHLPVTEIRVMQSKTSAQQTDAKLTLGPLKCWGDASSTLGSSVTFMTTSSYLRLRPWTSTSLQFMFRTHEGVAMLLNQTHSGSSSNSLTIELTTENSIQFSMSVNNKTLDIVLQLQHTLNDGKWHFVAMEMDKHNIRCTVDKERKLIDMPGNTVPSFHGDLYVGGYLNEEIMPGLKGCMRGLKYNDKDEDLSKITDPSIPGIIVGCRASCESSPCQNEAACVEHWGSYTCICTNQWAHWGDSCERNINTDEVSFDGNTASYLDIDGFKEDNLLDSTIILSFRTRESKAIILYIHDAMNNFLQLELEKGNRLRLSYNHFKGIVNGSLTFNTFNNGEWKQIVIHEIRNKNNLTETRMFVDSPDNYIVIPYSRLKLQKYSSHPFKHESLKPPRSEDLLNTKMNEFYRVFVGGAPVNATLIDPFVGCVRGLKIGNKVFSLQQEAHHNPAVANMCGEGCSPNPCLHNGKCIEKWGYNKFYCDCDKTNYAGDKCQIEASGNFTGRAVLEYNFDLLRNARHTYSEMFTLTFQTDITLTNKETILAVIMSARHPDHDILLFILTPYSISVRHYQKMLRKGLSTEGNYADGKPHIVQYWRSRGEMWLTALPHSGPVDDVSKAKVPNIQDPLDDLDKIMIGGVIHSQLPSYIENKDKFLNFTGCISEVTFTPVTDEPYSFKPMKDLRTFDNDSIITHGDEIVGCTMDHDEDIITTTETLSTTSPDTAEDRTMPPWNPGPAETIWLNAPLSTTAIPTTLTTTVQTIQTIPSTKPTTTGVGRLNITKSAISPVNIGTATFQEIVVAASIVVGLMIIALLIACVLCKKRKRDSYIVKKVPLDDLELKIPLNHTSSPPPSQKPYIARLDEFSMVSVTLGPKKRKENGILPGTEPLLCDGEISPEEYPVQSTFYNKKKNRPASSISEVLEEMERQKREKDVDENSGPDGESTMKQEGDLEWDPLTDRTPLTSGYFYQMLPSPILSVMDDIEELSIESASTFGTLDSMKKHEEAESEEDPLDVLEQQKDLTLEANGDSGYEAESRKDGEEDIANITPPTPEKVYMYDLTGQNSQKWNSMPSQKLLDYEESGT